MRARQISVTAEAAAAIAAYAPAGTYTPTLTNVTNVASSAAGVFNYARVGNTVIVSGRVTVTPTAAGAATELGVSLPIPSNFGGNDDCSGTAAATSVVSECAGIQSDATNDRARLNWVTTVNTLHAMRCIFSYQVI